MEISKKFSIGQTDEMANRSGFKPVDHFFDSRKWFTDAIWIAD